MVAAVTVGRATRAGQQADLFVVTDGGHATAGMGRQGAYGEWGVGHFDFFYKKGLHLKSLELVRYGLHYCIQHKDRSMFSIHKTPPYAGKATAAAVAAAVVACGVCCIPMGAPLAPLVLSPLIVWAWRKRLLHSASPACATDCSCKNATKNIA